MSYVAYKFRLYPNATQEKSLASQLETLRQVYNACLGFWRDKYTFAKEDGVEKPKSPTASEVYKLFSTLRNLQIADQKAGGSGPHWLTHVSAVSMRDTCERVKKAFDNFFRRVREKKDAVGYPRFKKYGRLTSIPFNNYNSGCVLRTPDGKVVKFGDDMIAYKARISVDRTKLDITGRVQSLVSHESDLSEGHENYNSGCVLRDEKGRPVKTSAPASRKGYRLDLFGVGRVKVFVHRDVVGTIKTACVERDVDGKWYVVLVCQQTGEKSEPKVGPAVGIDVGLEHFLTTSDAEHRPNPRILKGKLKELKTLQKSSSRKTEAAKGLKRKFRECKNLQKAFRRVAKLHVKVRNLRKDHHHKEANLLIDRYATVCVENLNVRGMVRNGKLARAISDAGWSAFLNVLKCKAEKAGARYVEVDARGTSQTCPQCQGSVRKSLKDRMHKCPHCGYATHRDHASAQVILQRGVVGDGAGLVPVGQLHCDNPLGNKGIGDVYQRISASMDISVTARKVNRSRASDKTLGKRDRRKPRVATESDAGG